MKLIQNALGMILRIAVDARLVGARLLAIHGKCEELVEIGIERHGARWRTRANKASRSTRVIVAFA
jgi:hypothetical protein